MSTSKNMVLLWPILKILLSKDEIPESINNIVSIPYKSPSTYSFDWENEILNILSVEEEEKISSIIGIYDINIENQAIKQLYECKNDILTFREHDENHKNYEINNEKQKENEIRSIFFSFLKVLIFI